MIHRRSVSSPFACTIACIAFVLVLNARARGEAANPAAALSALSAARESAAPAVTVAPNPLTPAAGAPIVANAEAAPVDPAAAKETSATKPAAKPALDEVHGLLNLGASLIDRAVPDWEAAEIAYRQVLNSHEAAPNDIKSALLGMAHMYRKHAELTKAAAVYERFLADYPGDARSPEALLELGRTLRDMGAFKLAIARFYSVVHATLKVDGADFEHYQILAKTAQFEIAETHFAAGEYEEATKYYTKFRLLDVAPADRARAHFKAAYAMKLQGNLEPAATALRAFIEQWPDDENIPEARYLLATTLRDLKRPQEAFAVALELLRAEKSRTATAPKRWLHWQLVTGNQLANEFYDAGDIVDAHTIYTSLLELSPDISWRLPITYQLGLCFERLGIIDRARTSYQSVVELAGPTPPAQFTELAHMAAWRIEHLEWREKTVREVEAFFDSTTGKQASIPTPAKTAATP